MIRKSGIPPVLLSNSTRASKVSLCFFPLNKGGQGRSTKHKVHKDAQKAKRRTTFILIQTTCSTIPPPLLFVIVVGGTKRITKRVHSVCMYALSCRSSRPPMQRCTSPRSSSRSAIISHAKTFYKRSLSASHGTRFWSHSSGTPSPYRSVGVR